jgi:hypothetical protein
LLTPLENQFREIASEIRDAKLNLGRQAYSLTLAHSVYQAVLCGYSKITAIELGVATGNGLRDLCLAADYFSTKFNIDIDVFGFDTGVGLPPLQDYRDHPEIWNHNDYSMGRCNLQNQLPTNAKLILGDVANTIPKFCQEFRDSRIGFVSIDLDLYSSTVSAMPLFEMLADLYLPALPVYVDDVHNSITYNPWCGESLAIREFNASHILRKFDEKDSRWRIQNFYVLHVMDHPFRNGTIHPPTSLSIGPF